MHDRFSAQEMKILPARPLTPRDIKIGFGSGIAADESDKRITWFVIKMVRHAP